MYSYQTAETPSGTFPAEEFILMQDTKMKAKKYKQDFIKHKG